MTKVKNATSMIYDLRMEMYHYDASDIAESCGISLSCVYNIRSGKTKWPRGRTIFKIADYLGIEIHMVKARIRNAH